MGFKEKLTFGLIVGTRNIFNAKLASEARKQLLEQMDKWGYSYVILPSDETPTGAIETVEDARKCAKLFRNNCDDVVGIIVVLPNFSDELGIVNTLNMARLNIPVLVQACDDDNDKVDVSSRRDAFCGKLSVCNNLYHYGIPFTDTTYHTYPLESPWFKADVDKFAAICRVVGGLKGARIGAIGARPGAFQTMRSSEKILQVSNITVVPVDLSEILDAARSMDNEAKDVKEMIKRIKNYGDIDSQITSSQMVRQAKFGVAVESWVTENNIDASAIQCWNSIQNTYGCASCVTMSMMSEMLIPSACEVDITGAISMYILALASGVPAALLDWNNNFSDDRGICVCTHCSNFPKSFIGKKPTIGTLDLLGTVVGSENSFGAVKGKVSPGPLTYYRLSTDDPKGIVKSYLGEGDVIDETYNMDGGIAVTKIPDLQKLMKYICKNGFEHHVAMCRGHVADIVEEAITTYIGWDLYRHAPT
jgi:L-fucose isomerase-like protein